jgi:hypothetical protein
MTTPRPWPNEAKEARDRAAEELAASLRDLQPVLDGQFPENYRLLVLRAMVHNQAALRHLEAVGAPTRPT